MPVDFTPGARVRVTAECPGWLPASLVGSVAEVLHVSPHSAVIRLLTPQHADRALRYVPALATEECLAAWDGKD